MFLRKLRQHLQPGRQILKLSSMWVLVFAAFLNSWKTNYKWQRRPNISRSLRGMVMVVEAFEAIEVKGNTVLPGYMLPIYQYVRQNIIRLITCFSNFWLFHKISWNHQNRMTNLCSNPPFCSNDLMISSERKN